MKRKITIGTTYYENPSYLHNFIQKHGEYADEIIIVDDGSSIYPIEEQMDFGSLLATIMKKTKIYKVLEDHGFNSHGCRNLIMSESSNEWNILLDIDRELCTPDDTFQYLMNDGKKLDSHSIYKFYAHVERLGNRTHKSVNDFFISKSFFFSVGGYDEELIGIRDGDRFFMKQLFKTVNGKERILHGHDLLLIRPPSVSRKDIIVSPNDGKRNKRACLEKIAHRIEKPEPNKPILTFEWKRIFPTIL